MFNRCWLYASKSFGSRNMNIGSNNYNFIIRKIKFYWLKLIASFKSKYRLVLNKKCTVGSQLPGIINHLLISKFQIKLLIHQSDKKSCICRPSPKARPYWYMFMQMNFYGRQVKIFFQ